MVERVLLLGLAVGFGFSGYLLPWNELAVAATKVGTDIPGIVPVVGHFIVHFLRGGTEVTGATLTRFYGFHVGHHAGLARPFLGLHLLLIQFQGMSLPLGMSEKKVRDDRPFFSEFMLIDFCLGLLFFGVLVTLAVWQPAEVGVKADLLKPARGHSARVVFHVPLQDPQVRSRPHERRAGRSRCASGCLR